MIPSKKTIIQRFAGKASVKRKGLQTLCPLHRAVSPRGLMRRTIRGNCVLRNAMWGLSSFIMCLFTRAQERRPKD